jgi:hypothetical protein
VDLRQRLQLIVDATTGKADAEFRKLTGTTKELGASAESAANRVRAAADRVAEAREKERVAAGQLQVAERRLQELRDSGRARASQLLAAEEKAAAAQRTLQRAVAGTSRALQEQEQAGRDAAQGLQEAERGSGILANVSERARAGLAGLAGAGIGAGLRGIADGFATGARAAGQFATSTNSSVEQAGAFLGLVGSLGLELNDLLEIQAEYAQKAAASSAELDKLGAGLQRNEDGTVNWTESLVLFLDQLQQVPDATERNRLGFQFLGEEGYKQLSRLVSSGVDVRDALEQIGTPFTEADIQAAADYDREMMNLTLTGQRTSQTLGRVLLPVVTGLMEGVGDFVAVLEEAGPVLVLTTAAAIALGVTGFSPTAVAGARLATVTAIVTRNLALYRATAGLAGVSSATLGAAWAGASAGARGLLGMVGGPLGASLVALGTAYTLVSQGADDFRESAQRGVSLLANLEDRYGDMAMSSRELGRQLAAEAGMWEGLAASRRGATEALEAEGAGLWDTVTGGILATGTAIADQFTGGELAARGYANEMDRAREEMGEFAVQQEVATGTTRTLNDLIAQGVTTGDEFGRSVRDAAEAQAAQEQTSGLATAAIDAYRRATDGAVEATLNLINAQLAQSDALIGFQQTVHDAADVVDDLSTPWDEVQEAQNRVVAGALDVAGSYADSAVAAAQAGDQIVTDLDEARIRGEATIKGLYGALQQENITAGARAQIRDMIKDLEEAQESGDIEALLRLTGVAETTGELDQATEDREALIHTESRGGPAVLRYLDGIADRKRLALIRTESRNGPAVDEYLGRVAGRSRLALIRVESRNGPAVDAYLDSLASQPRTAWIDVRERSGGGGGGSGGPFGVMRGGAPTATGPAGAGGNMTIQQLQMIVQADSTGRVTQQSLAEAGRQAVRSIAAYERRNGTGWRQQGRR